MQQCCGILGRQILEWPAAHSSFMTYECPTLRATGSGIGPHLLWIRFGGLDVLMDGNARGIEIE